MANGGEASVRILIVDDHPLFLRGVRDLVETSEDIVIVGEATSDAEALRMVADNHPDVAVLDVSLQKTSGVALMRQILAGAGAPRCLLLSAHEDSTVIKQALAAGAAGYLFKRSTGEHLLRAIRTANRNRLYLDPAIGSRLGLGIDIGPAQGKIHLRKDLTAREREVVKLIAFGFSNKEIASRLGVTAKSIETYKMRASEKLDIRTRSKFVQFALSQGWFQDIQS